MRIALCDCVHIRREVRNRFDSRTEIITTADNNYYRMPLIIPLRIHERFVAPTESFSVNQTFPRKTYRPRKTDSRKIRRFDFPFHDCEFYREA